MAFLYSPRIYWNLECHEEDLNKVTQAADSLYVNLDEII